VRYLLIDELRQKHLEFSKALLDELMLQETIHFTPIIITGDELWLIFEYSHDHI
jgi:hypothetical protein